MPDINSDIQYLKGVGPAYAKKFAKLGIYTIRDLLLHYPRRYIDYSQPYTVVSAPFDVDCCVKATVLQRDPDRRTRAGEVYCALRADAYMVRSPENQGLILEIDGGIKKEVSVGCSIGKKVCSICGADRQEATCGHQPGKKYGGRLCYTLLEDPTDAYEWSFVAVPAQPAAGVTKSHAARKALHLTPERAIAEMERGELHLDAAAAYGLRKHIAALEKKSEEAGRYRQSLCETIRRRTMLAQPQMPPALLEKSMAPLTVTELEELAALMKQQAEKRFAPMVQTAPAPENETDNRAFCI